jgi:uncharacterized membrane protein YhaH (DUF805 family)
MNYYIAALKKYAVFDGRARRAEYWYFVLFNLIAQTILSILDTLIGKAASMDIGVLVGLYSLAVFVPSLALSVRRLHDTGHSAWWLLIGLVPFVGAIVLLVFVLQDSQPGTNQFGPSPKEVSVA